MSKPIKPLVSQELVVYTPPIDSAKESLPFRVEDAYDRGCEHLHIGDIPQNHPKLISYSYPPAIKDDPSNLFNAKTISKVVDTYDHSLALAKTELRLLASPAIEESSSIDSIALERTALAHKINTHLSSLHDQAFFIGSVMIQQGDQILFTKGYGLSTDGITNATDTPFHVGSITKQFTAAAIMKLVEMGKLDVTTPIKEVLPEKYYSDKWSNITIHHLLSHTSGICEYTGDTYEAFLDYLTKCENLTRDSILLAAKEKNLKFEPGTQFSYCNTGYLLLGEIIENISGMSYKRFMEEQILTPAGMLSSTIHDDTWISPRNAALGYKLNDEGSALIRESRNDDHINGADGALVSTPADLIKWSRVLDGSTPVLTKASVELMKTPVLGNYGYGLTSNTYLGENRVQHGGTLAGFQAMFCKYPDKDLTIVILSNNGNSSPDTINQELSQIVLHPEISVPHPIPFPKDFNFSGYKHRFSTDNPKYADAQLVFTRRDDRLLIQILPTKELHPLILLSNGFLHSPFQSANFQLQPDGSLGLYDAESLEILDYLQPESL